MAVASYAAATGSGRRIFRGGGEHRLASRKTGTLPPRSRKRFWSVGACLVGAVMLARWASLASLSRAPQPCASALCSVPRPTGIVGGRGRLALLHADAVCFDVDSTLVSDEGIDLLAEHMHVGPAVREFTRSAMSGHTRFEDALRARLDLIRPARADVTDCLREHPQSLMRGAKAVVDALHGRGVRVHLVSGGFQQMIEPIATALNVPLDRIHANHLVFDALGRYAGFDALRPTSRDNGKALVVAQLKRAHGYRTVVMIGDGATDLQAAPEAAAVIGFGGVVQRDSVRNRSDWYITEWEELLDVLQAAPPAGA